MLYFYIKCKKNILTEKININLNRIKYIFGLEILLNNNLIPFLPIWHT